MTTRIRKTTDADDVAAADDEVAERLDHVPGASGPRARAAGSAGSTATFSASRKSVTTSRTDGKVENSSGSCVYIADHQDDERERDRQREQQVEQHRRQRDHHDEHHRRPARAGSRVRRRTAPVRDASAPAVQRCWSCHGFGRPPERGAAAQRVDVGEDLGDRAIECGGIRRRPDRAEERARERAPLDDRHAAARAASLIARPARRRPWRRRAGPPTPPGGSAARPRRAPGSSARRRRAPPRRACGAWRSRGGRGESACDLRIAFALLAAPRGARSGSS